MQLDHVVNAVGNLVSTNLGEPHHYHAPRVLASLRNAAVYVLRNLDHPSVAAATRAMSARPELALGYLKNPGSFSE